jgi:hypothetical protein
LWIRKKNLCGGAFLPTQGKLQESTKPQFFELQKSILAKILNFSIGKILFVGHYYQLLATSLMK